MNFYPVLKGVKGEDKNQEFFPLSPCWADKPIEPICIAAPLPLLLSGESVAGVNAFVLPNRGIIEGMALQLCVFLISVMSLIIHGKKPFFGQVPRGERVP